MTNAFEDFVLTEDTGIGYLTVEDDHVEIDGKKYKQVVTNGFKLFVEGTMNFVKENKYKWCRNR